METFSENTADDGAHLDAVIVPEIDDDAHDPDAPIAIGEDGEPLSEAPPEQISQEAFWTVFQMAFNVPGQIVPDLRPMAIQPPEVSAAKAASDATYSLLEIYYPKALMPQSETLALLMVAGPFFIGKAMIVREIIRAKKAKPVPQEEPSTGKAKPATAPEPDDMQQNGDVWHLPGQEKAA